MPPGFARRRGGKAFTLIEVLVTLVIVSVGLVAILRAYQIAVSALEQTRETLRATMLIDQILAEREIGALEKAEAPVTTTGRFASPYDDYVWEQKVVEVGLVPALPPEVAKRCRWYEVEVSVWKERGLARRLTANSMMAVPQDSASK